MSAKSLDPQVLTSTATVAIDQVLSKMSGGVRSEAPQTKELEIEEYDGRMKAAGGSRFDAPCYVSVVNYYLSKAEMDRHKPKGALVFYLDSENAGKLYKSLDIKVPEDEDDRSMLDACEKFCGLVAESFKNGLATAGYVDLLMSEPQSNRNAILGGVEFSTDQTIKFEFSFIFWKRTTIVVEITLADIPRKR